MHALARAVENTQCHSLRWGVRGERRAASWGAGFMKAGCPFHLSVEVSVGRWLEAWRSGEGRKGCESESRKQPVRLLPRNLGFGSSWVLSAWV